MNNKKRLQAYRNRLYLKMPKKSSRDVVSQNVQTDTSAGPAYYIHPDTGELVTVAAGEVLNHPTLGNVSFDTYEQLCQNSEDPGEWANWDLLSKTPTGVISGPFNEAAFVDNGSIVNRARLWVSTISGSPGGALYFCIRYRPGTSGNIRVYFLDSGVSDRTYSGVIGAASISGTGAGTLTIISDEYDPKLGYYILKGSILFTNLANNLSVSIGPNSTDNSSILVLGADVSEDPTILDFHVPSSGSNVTIASRAGTTKLADIDTDFSKFRDSLWGVADRVELVENGVDWVGASGVIPPNAWASSGVGIVSYSVLDLSTIANMDSTTLNIAVTGTGSVSTIMIFTGTGIGERYRIKMSYREYLGGGIPGRYYISGLLRYFSASGVTTEDGKIESYDFTATMDNFQLEIIAYTGNIIQIPIISVQKISPAAARHSFTWTPGVDYTDHTTVESIMTPSDSDGFLKASAAGGFELSDGTNTLSLENVNWVAGTEYPMTIVYGKNEALNDYKMELSAYVNDSWMYIMGTFDEYFDIDDDFILGLENPFQSAVKNHTVERLLQSYWRTTPYYYIANMTDYWSTIMTSLWTTPMNTEF